MGVSPADTVVKLSAEVDEEVSEELVNEVLGVFVVDADTSPAARLTKMVEKCIVYAMVVFEGGPGLSFG